MSRKIHNDLVDCLENKSVVKLVGSKYDYLVDMGLLRIEEDVYGSPCYVANNFFGIMDILTDYQQILMNILLYRYDTLRKINNLEEFRNRKRQKTIFRILYECRHISLISYLYYELREVPSISAEAILRYG